MRIGGPRRPLDREIARLAVPALVTLLAEPAYLLADTAVVGHLGTEQLSGLAIATAILLTGYSLCIFLAYGTTAAVGRLLGAGERQEAAHQAAQSMWLAFAIGSAMAVVGEVFSRPLVHLLGAEGRVAEYALLYLRISLIGYPALLLMLAGTGYLRGLQDTRTPLAVALGTAAGNLVLEVVLIYGLGLGIGASAAATVFAQFAGAGVYLVVVARNARRDGAGLAPHLASQRRLLRVGADLVVRTAALRGSLLAITAVAARIGATELAAQQIVFEIWSALAMGLDALAIAAQAMIGHRLGAGDAVGVREASQRLLVIGGWASAATATVIAVSSPFLPHVFSADPAVVALASFLLLWVAALQPLAALVFVLDGVLIGAGDQRFLARGMALAAACMLVVLVPVLPLGLGIGWVWAAFAVLMGVRAVTLVVRYRGDAWVRLGAAA